MKMECNDTHTHTHTLASPYAEKTRKRWSGQTSAQEELMTDENFTNTTVHTHTHKATSTFPADLVSGRSVVLKTSLVSLSA